MKKFLYLFSLYVLACFISFNAGKNVVKDKNWYDGFNQAMAHTKPQELIPSFYPAYKVEIRSDLIKKVINLNHQGSYGAVPVLTIPEDFKTPLEISDCTINSNNSDTGILIKQKSGSRPPIKY